MPKRIMPPSQRPGLDHRDRVAEPAQVVRRGHARRAGADDQHVLAGLVASAASKRQPCFSASSPRKRSTELMPTALVDLAAVARRLRSG